MDFFFNPRGIALVGATPHPKKGGSILLKNLTRGFKGPVYPVNSRYREIDSLICYPSVRNVPDPVDLAIIFVPAPLVPGIVKECAGRGLAGVIIESGGFAETGEKGKKLQDELSAVIRETGIRVWGPNCMGLVDARRGHVFSFVSSAIWDEGLVPGEVSLVVQSGMLSAGFLIDLMSHGTMGISKACSIGNKADVNEVDLLRFLVDDSDTGAVGMYLESIPQGRKFTEICRHTQKPVVVLKAGRSPAGAAAAMSHTASMAGNDAVVRDMLTQAGVIMASDFVQMMDICRTLSAYPDLPAKKPRIAVLTFSGGAGIMSADFIDELNMETAHLSSKTVEALREIFPEWMPVSNPVDLWPAVERNGLKRVYGAAVRAVCADENVDAVLFHAFVGGFSAPEIPKMAQYAREAGKPVFCWVMGRQEAVKKFMIAAHTQKIPAFRELHRAVECIRAAFGRVRPAAARIKAVPQKIESGASLQALITGHTGVLDEHLSKQVLAAAGIPTVQERLVLSESEMDAAVRELGFPLAAKGLVPEVVHKTDRGLVRLNISTPDEAKAVFAEFHRRMDHKGKVLIQKQVIGSRELIAGMVVDPQFGPCVMCGLGGVFTEILKDVVFGAAPLTPSDAMAMIGRLKNQQLLDGFRGAVPVDRQALVQVLTALGDLALNFPRIREIDINPLIISSGRPVAVDATLVLTG